MTTSPSKLSVFEVHQGPMNEVDPQLLDHLPVLQDRHLSKRSMDIHADDTHAVPPVVQGSKRACTTSTDPRSQRSRASRRGGHVTTRARSSWKGRPAAVLCSRHPYPGGPAIHRLRSRFHRVAVSGNSMPNNNAAERAMRAPVLGRRNYLFCGSDTGGQRAACIYTIIETCKLNGIDPQAYLADVLGRIADHPIQRIDELLPWHWQK